MNFLTSTAWRMLRSVFLVAAIFGSNLSYAGQIVIDFEDQPGGSFIGNFTSNGFTFSPGCHYDIVGGATGKWIGFDTGGCSGPPNADGGIGFNENYLGPFGAGQSTLYVVPTLGGLFSLKSFDFATIGDTGGLHVQSSKGGDAYIDYLDGPFTTHELTGKNWQNIEWLVFQSFAPGEPVGFDNLVVNPRPISEPSSLTLILLTLLILVAVRSTHRRIEVVARGLGC